MNVLCNIVKFILFFCSFKNEEQISNSALDHIHHISEMCKLEENKFNEGDSDKNDGSFGSIPLSDAINQPLFRKSKSQVVVFFFFLNPMNIDHTTVVHHLHS